MTKALTWVELSKSALLHNLEIAQQSADRREVIPVIKANAYGHGMIEVARLIEENTSVDRVAVARLDEALQLRETGFKLGIIVLSGIIDEEDLKLSATHQLEAVVHSIYTLEQLLKLEGQQPTFWLKLNTGMNRLGIATEDIGHCHQLLEKLNQTKNPHTLQGIMTHFSSSEDLSSSSTDTQLSLFTASINSLKASNPGSKLCLANSAAIFYHQNAHFDAVRLGISLYGLAANIKDTELKQALRPVMRFKATILSIQAVKAGQTVGYNDSYTIPTDTRIAVISAGYADGYPRHTQSGTPVFINGRTAELVGRVSMDLITVNLGNIEAQIGDEVELWGENISCDVVAQSASTISYEPLTHINERVKRY